MSECAIATDLTLHPGDYLLARIPEGFGRLVVKGTYYSQRPASEALMTIAQKVKAIVAANRHIELNIRRELGTGVATVGRFPNSNWTMGFLPRRSERADRHPT